MIRVHIVYDVEGWAYWHRARILQEYAPHDMQISIAPYETRWKDVGPIDIIFDLNYGQTTMVRQQLAAGRLSTVFLASFNRGWPDRREYFNTICGDAHAVVVNNYSYWHNAGKLPGTYHIANGVDRRVFSNITPIRERATKMMWVGSDYHRTTKNYDAILVPLGAKLKGVAEADWRMSDPYGAKMTHPEMADWYNSGSVYVVASGTEGTPNPALEAAACGCVLVTTRVGNMPELVKDGVNAIFVDPTLASVEAGVRRAMARREELSAQMQSDIADWDWKHRTQEFYQLFRDLLSGSAQLRRPLGSR